MHAIRPLSVMDDEKEKRNSAFQSVRGSVSWLGQHLNDNAQRVRGVRSNNWLLVLYAVLLVGTQVGLVLVPALGLSLNVFTLFVLTGGALLRDQVRKVSISLAIIPIAQMTSSTIITHNAFLAAAVLYSLLLVLTLVYRYMFTLDEPTEATRLRLKGHAFGLPLMLVLGESLGGLGYAFLRHHYQYTHISLPLVAAACIVFAFAEEMLLRGLVQQQASRIAHPVVAVVLTSVLYTTLAFNHTTFLTLGPAVAMGTALALVYHYKRNLLLSVTINAAAKLTYVGLVATFILR